jgi:drug/metabolite transporter (DMT)-like permease
MFSFYSQLRYVSSSIVLFHTGSIGIIIFGFMTFFIIPGGFKMEECGIQSYLFIALAIIGFYSQTLNLLALKCENASLIAITRQSLVVLFSYLFQITLFHRSPDNWSIIGTVIALTAVAMITFRKYQAT